jgi:AAA domain
MKSLSWLSACLEAVHKKKVWGQFAANVDSVLFLETEDPAWMVESRVRGLAKGLGIGEKDEVPGFHYACVGPFDFLNNKENRIEELIQRHKPNFIVLSTLQNLLNGRDYNGQNDMQPIMAAMIKIAQSAPLVLITHSPWDRRQRRAAGTVAQTANFLTALHYEKKIARKTGKTFVHVSVDSKAGALETDFSLKLDIDGSPRDPGSVRKVAYIGKGWPKGTGKEAILAELENDPDASPQEIAERTGMGLRHVQKVIKDKAEAQ